MKQRPQTCITPECPKASYRRGVCQSCYESYRRSVAAKNVTWRKLEKLELVKPSASKKDGVSRTKATIALKAATQRASKAKRSVRSAKSTQTTKVG